MLGTNLRIAAVTLGTLALYTLLANAIPQIESQVPEELSFSGAVTAEQLVAAGEELYNGAGGCTACHGLGTRAPNLTSDEGGTGLIGARCAGRVQGQSCKEYLYASLVEPNAYVVDGYEPIMPDLSRTLSAAQLWALVAYLESLGGTVTVTAEDLGGAEEPAGTGGRASLAGAAGPAAPADVGPRGADATTASLDPLEILLANQCLACHQLGGEGGPVGPPFDGIGARVDADYIRRSILEPDAEVAAGYEALAGTMPRTYGQQLTAAQLEAIVRFLSDQR